jgi:hypothetical protein
MPVPLSAGMKKARKVLSKRADKQVKNMILSYAFYVDCIGSFTTLFNIENYSVIGFDLIDQTIGVYKSFCSGLVMLNKAEPLFLIEELHSSCDLCAHCVI